MKNLFGAGYTFALFLFLLASAPVYLYRYFVIFLAKRFRSDLGDILNGQSALFAGDHLDGSSRAPRSNVLAWLTFDRPITYEEVKAEVLKHWMQRNSRNNTSDSKTLTLEKFCEYPVNWLGFTFWRKIFEDKETLVSYHVEKLFGSHVGVTNDLFDAAVEKLLNSRLPQDKSPWMVYVIENFRDDRQHTCTSESNKSKHKSIIIFKFHHCLTDGYGIITAISQGLLQSHSLATPHYFAVSRPPGKTWWQNWAFWASFPLSAFLEMSYALSHTFRESPWKIPDKKKQWHQLFAKTRPISVQDIKDIKNRFRVSFTGVILSAVSAALADSPLTGLNKDAVNSIFCLSSLPAPGRQEKETLSNHMTGAMFDLPLGPFRSPTERLFAVDQMLQKNKQSVLPVVGRYFTGLLGSHLHLIKGLLVKNKIVSVALSNFIGATASFSLGQTGAEWCQSGGILGGFDGDTGLVIGALSHGNEIQIQISVEGGLLSREEARAFVQRINQEIEDLKTELEHKS